MRFPTHQGILESFAYHALSSKSFFDEFSQADSTEFYILA